MATGISIIAKALKIKYMHIDRVEYVEGTAKANKEEYKRDKIVAHARPFKRIRHRCPLCGRDCGVYDHQAREESTWRANSLNGVPVLLQFKPTRINCPEHGVHNEYVPWSDGDTRFTPSFNDEVAYLALTCPKTVVSQFMAINWRTVGNCIKAAHGRIEPDVSARLHGLRRICVDETSYRKGQKYVTVVYDMDRNRVVWVCRNHGYEVFKQFCEALAPEERDAIEIVAGDGARWIDSCTEEYFKNATRCVDFFHVVEWINECLDKVRMDTARQAQRDVDAMQKEFKKAEDERREAAGKAREELEKAKRELDGMPSRGRPSKRKKELEAYVKELEARLEDLTDGKDEAVEVSKEEYEAAVKELGEMPRRGRRSARKAQLLTLIALYEGNAGNDGGEKLSAAQKKVIDDLKKKAADIKGTKYALGMNPENLSESLQDKLSLVQESFPELYKAYRLKEQLRVILHMKDRVTAEIALDKWIAEAKESSAEHFVELAAKIERHRGNILNAVEFQANSSRSEATNTTIKALIKTARGFRNLDNMFALIYLRCSDLTVPLNNRYNPSAKKMKELRDIQNMRKKQREEQKMKERMSQPNA